MSGLNLGPSLSYWVCLLVAFLTACFLIGLPFCLLMDRTLLGAPLMGFVVICLGVMFGIVIRLGVDIVRGDGSD